METAGGFQNLPSKEQKPLDSLRIPTRERGVYHAFPPPMCGLPSATPCPSQGHHTILYRDCLIKPWSPWVFFSGAFLTPLLLRQSPGRREMPKLFEIADAWSPGCHKVHLGATAKVTAYCGSVSGRQWKQSTCRTQWPSLPFMRDIKNQPPHISTGHPTLPCILNQGRSDSTSQQHTRWILFSFWVLVYIYWIFYMRIHYFPRLIKRKREGPLRRHANSQHLKKAASPSELRPEPPG